MAWSRRDQMQAHQFLRRRSTSALVLADPDHPESATRRPLLATVGGAVALALLLAGFGVYGVLRPGSSTQWQQPGAIVVQKDTGARFVLGADRRLHPVLNYASARLVVGSAQPKIVSASAASLRRAPRGRPIGVPGAPDALPAAGSLSTTAWTVCTRPAADRGAPVTTVLLGNPPSGADLAAGGLLLRDRHGVTHLLAEGRRFALAGRAVLNALNYTGTTPIAVPDAWLDAVPAGTDLRFPVVPGRGGKPRWRSPAGVLVGHILRVGDVGTSTRYFLVERTGLRPLGATGTALALGDPAAASAYGDDPVRPVPVSPSALLGAPDAPAPTAPANYPNRPPDLLEVPRSDVAAICVPVAGNGAPATPRLVPVDALTARSPIPVAGPATGPREVVVPAGGGALVRAGGTDGMVFLVTDQGSRFPVPDPAARTALGYGGATPVEMPAAVIGLLPPGPALDRAAAARISTG